MSKSKLILVVSLFLISCSTSDDLFDEKEHVLIFPDFSCEVSRNTMYLQGYIHISGSAKPYLLQNSYLESFFWIVNNDTIKTPWVVEEMPYGKYFVKLFIKDIFGDTASISDSVWVEESFSIDLLSPVDEFSDLSKGDIVLFQYKTNGFNEEHKPKVYICAISEGCDNPTDCCDKQVNWKELKGDTLELKEPVFWKVEISIMPGISIESSEIRSIWPKD